MSHAPPFLSLISYRFRGLTVVSVKGLSSVGGVTRLAYTVESGGVGPWGGAPRAMLHEAGQYCFINVSKARAKYEECETPQRIQNEEDTSEVVVGTKSR